MLCHRDGHRAGRSLETTFPTALIALSNGLTVERLANPDPAPDELFAHAIAAVDCPPMAALLSALLSKTSPEAI